jgi:hypothetical protein
LLCSYQGPDAATLFWLGRPRIMLRMLQVIYFENSLSGELAGMLVVSSDKGFCSEASAG